MTVAELIGVLQTLPQEMEVFTENVCADEGTSYADPDPQLDFYYLDRHDGMTRFYHSFVSKDKLVEAVFL